MIWDNTNIGHSDQRDKIQNKALRFIICYKCNKCILRNPHTRYENIIKMFNVESLKIRKNIACNTFLFRLLNNEIDDSFILSQILLVNIHNIRNIQLFYIPHFSKKYLPNDPINISMFSGNNQTVN